MPGYVQSFLQTKDDGSYQIGKIPPGRYILKVDPNGPWDGCLTTLNIIRQECGPKRLESSSWARASRWQESILEAVASPSGRFECRLCGQTEVRQLM